MKTVVEALLSKVHWPMPISFVETVCIERNIDGQEAFTYAVSTSTGYKGALADCYFHLFQAVNYSEAGKSVGNLTDEQRRWCLKQANKLYGEIGEEEKEIEEPTVYFGG